MKLRVSIIGLIFLAASISMPAPVIAVQDSRGFSVAVEKYVRTELYLGMSRRNGPTVSEEDFQKFIDEFVTPRFPSGLTVIDARGQWREDDSTITKERGKVLILIYAKKDRRGAGVKIEQLREEYKKRFAQDSVVRVDMSKSLDVSFD